MSTASRARCVLRLALAAGLLIGVPVAPRMGQFARAQQTQPTRQQAPQFDRVYPHDPADGAWGGSRPIFELGFEGVAEEDERRMRFRLELRGTTGDDSRDDREGQEEQDDPRSFVFDQRERRSGWMPANFGSVLFRPPRPLPDGVYRWSVQAWNGFEWKGGGGERVLHVDTIPPAEVEGLELQRLSDGTVRLQWNPVALDVAGAPEYVAAYHVFRYDRDPTLPRRRLFRIGVSEIPRFEDDDPGPDSPLRFYRIAAEDRAGNVPGVRR